MTNFPETQNSLLVRLRSHEDRGAWEKFVNLYRPVIYRIARRKGFQEADAQDLSQRVLTSIANSIHRWEQLDPPVRFRHWLNRVVRNAIINAATRGPKEVVWDSVSDEQLLAATSIDEKSESEIALEYRREVLKQAAAQVRHNIAEETWLAFELTVVQGNDVEATARRLNKSVGCVYAARSRIMKRLKEAVGALEEWNDE